MRSVALIFALAVGSASATSETPVSKAVQLLSGLHAKITAEGEKSTQLQEENAEFCKDRSKELAFEIKTGTSQVGALKAAIADHSAQVASLSTKMEELAGGIASDDADLSAAKEMRAKESGDFAAETKELDEVIDTLQRAIGLLEREMQKGGASLLQNAGSMTQAFAALVQASALSSADASKLTALIQSSQHAADEADDEGLGAPDAAVYQSKSGSIVDTLEDLLDKARDQLRSAQKQETNGVHNFQMVQQALEDSMAYANKDLAAAKKARSESEGKQATAQGDLTRTATELQSDTDALAELQKDCVQKANDFAASTKSRGEELAAIAEAQRVLSVMTGGAEQITYGLSQVSFLQRSSTTNHEVVKFLRQLARKHNAPALSQLASRVASTMLSSSNGDVFGKVKGLISDLIERLEGEAAADATEKQFCDSETAKSNAAKDEQTATIDGLTTKIDQKNAASAQLKEEVATLQNELAKLAAAQVAMNKLRQEEAALYLQNKADLDAGVQGVQLALRVLRDYYGSEGRAHDGAEGASTSIIGLLEVVESDFSRDLASTVVTEETAKADFEKQTHQNDIEKATKDQDVKYKTKESASLDKESSELQGDRATVQVELDAVTEYLEKLHERCVPKPETYGQRKGRRDAEIAGLRQALEILEGQAAFLQTGRSLRGVNAHRGCPDCR